MARSWLSYYGAGGGCTDAGGKAVAGSLGPGIAAATVITNNQLAAFAAAGVAARTRGGGGSSGGSGGAACDVFIGVVTTAPTGGYGAGTVQKVVFHSDGTWTTSGGTVNVVFPRI